jgi:hypothetical protein
MKLLQVKGAVPRASQVITEEPHHKQKSQSFYYSNKCGCNEYACHSGKEDLAGKAVILPSFTVEHG